MNEQDEVMMLIACVPCLEGIQMGYKPYKDSVIRTCKLCGRSIWVGPESYKKHREAGIDLLCMICVAEEAKKCDEKPNIIRLTDKKMGE